LEQDLHLSALRIYNLEVQLKRDAQGQWNHARMASTQTKESVEEDTKDPSKPFDLKIDAVEIRDGVLFFTDELASGGFGTTAREINIDVKDFALNGKQSSPLNLVLETDRGESASIKGLFALSPFSMVLDTELRNIDVAAYEPYYEGVYSVPIEGKIDFRANIASNPEQPFLLSGGQIELRDAYMAFNENEGMKINETDISNISFDLARNRLEIDSAEYRDSRINFSRTTKGHWTILSNNFPILAALTEAPEEQPVPEVKAEGPVFSYRIGTLAIKNLEIDINDKLPATATNLNASAINLVFNNLAAPEKVESPFTFSAVFQRKGEIDIKGTASLADQSVSMSSLLKRIPLASLSPYIEEHLNLVLTEGDLSTKLQTTVAAGSDTPQLSFSGDIGVSRFHLIDSIHQEDLLKWDSLQVAGIKGGLEPLSLEVKSITLSDYFAKVLIDKEARLNLTEAFRKKEDQDLSDKQEQESPPEKSPDSGVSPIIEINTITLQGGQVDFTDRHLPRPFTADMRDLGGRIEGLSSEAESRARVDLRGRLRNQSPLEIGGVINPLAEKLFLDLKLNFHDIELSPLSPYSGNYVGYLIEKGKLNLALEYYLEDNQLKAKNKVFLDQFSFGDEIESENSSGLPVKLAVALLKDRNGEIHLDIPVSGSLEDPQFSIGGVIWTVVKNLLVKAATSPFALLGAMLGDSEEDFSQISFAYGSSSLSSTEAEKLERMAQALADRPNIDVEVSGFVDRENDEEGYRSEQLKSQIKRLKFLDLIKKDQLAEGSTEENVVVPVEEYDEYLWQIYSKSDFPKPRNFIGMTKKIPPSEMEKLIYTHTEVSPDDLAGLAQARALAVQRFLVEEGQLAPERIFLKKPDIMAAPEEETTHRARVELGATVH
jgi:outer membrane protein OmpA-like peptidoglycan-associated protein